MVEILTKEFAQFLDTYYKSRNPYMRPTDKQKRQWHRKDVDNFFKLRRQRIHRWEGSWPSLKGRYRQSVSNRIQNYLKGVKGALSKKEAAIFENLKEKESLTLANIKKKSQKEQQETFRSVLLDAKEDRKGLNKVAFDISQRRAELRTQLLRGKKRSLKNEIDMAGLTALQVIANTAKGYRDLPKTLANVAKNPAVLAKVPAELKRGAEEFGVLARVSPTETMVLVGTNVVLLKGEARAISALSKASKSAISKKIKTDPFGVQTIKNVPKVGDIDVIPVGKAPKLKVDINKAIKAAMVDKQLKAKPSLPKATAIERRIIKVVKKKGDALTGSYAQEALLKPKFARKHKDLDVLTKNRQATMRALKKEFGKNVKFKKKFRSIVVYYKGKPVADLVKFKVGEGGFVKKLGTIKVRGLNLATPKARLGGKLIQLKAGQKKKKVLKDIEALTGRRTKLDKPAVKGAFAYPAKEQRKIIGKKVPVITSQIDLLGKGIFKPAQLKLKKFLYATPADPKTGRGQVRVSRLGISKSEEASLLDLLGYGKDPFPKISVKKNKPQIFVFPKEKIFAKPSGVYSKGKFAKTPKGFVVPEFSKELEVVLGKGWIVKRGKTLTRVKVEGRAVPIIEAKKIKIPADVKKLGKEVVKARDKLNKLSKGKTRKAQINTKRAYKSFRAKEAKLVKKLKKETGLNYRTSSLPVKGRKYLSIKKPAIQLTRAIRTKKKPTRPSVRKPTSRSPRKPVSKSPRRPPARSPPRSPKRPSRPVRSPPTKAGRSPPKSPPKTPPRAPPKSPPPPPSRGKQVAILPRSKKKKIRKIRRKTTGYRVEEKRGGKYRPLRGSPLSKKDALNRLAFRLDNKISRSARLVNVGKVKVGRGRKIEQDYYAKTKKNLRQYKIRKGKKIPTPNTYIEKKGKPLISTKGEKRQLMLNRMAKARAAKKVKKRKK